jgi:hypothetical protein
MDIDKLTKCIHDALRASPTLSRKKLLPIVEECIGGDIDEDQVESIALDFISGNLRKCIKEAVLNNINISANQLIPLVAECMGMSLEAAMDLKSIVKDFAIDFIHQTYDDVNNAVRDYVLSTDNIKKEEMYEHIKSKTGVTDAFIVDQKSDIKDAARAFIKQKEAGTLAPATPSSAPGVDLEDIVTSFVRQHETVDKTLLYDYVKMRTGTVDIDTDEVKRIARVAMKESKTEPEDDFERQLKLAQRKEVREMKKKVQTKVAREERREQVVENIERAREERATVREEKVEHVARIRRDIADISWTQKPIFTDIDQIIKVLEDKGIPDPDPTARLIFNKAAYGAEYTELVEARLTQTINALANM